MMVVKVLPGSSFLVDVKGLFRKNSDTLGTMPDGGFGDEVVVYATVPTAAVLGKFTVKSVDSSELRDLWQVTRKVAAVSNSEFDAYFDGLNRGVGIWIANTQRYSASVSLTDLRNWIPGFHPPQGFRYLNQQEVQIIETLAKGTNRPRRSVAKRLDSSVASS